MPFWDVPFDIQSNSAIIGFDSDQNFVGGGFTLVWNSHKIHDYDFTYVFEAHEFVSTQAEYLFGSVMFNTDKGITFVTLLKLPKRFHGTNLCIRILINTIQTRKSTKRNSKAK